MFRAYPKIHRLGKEETEGIFDGFCYIQEKIDGANTSIWLDNGDLQMGSRTQVLYRNGEKTKDFRGFQEYVLKHEGIINLLKDHPEYRLYGERLVKHTVNYPVEYYNRFFLFDIYDEEHGKYCDCGYVNTLAEIYNIDKPQLFLHGKTNKEEVEQYVTKNVRGCVGEGIVIKNLDFINKFGDGVYAKIVHDEFKEKNSIIFGNHTKDDIEMKFVATYITPERVRKIVHKIEQNEQRKIDIKDTPRVMGTVTHDAFEEEMWGYSGTKTINMGRIKKLSGDRAKFIFHEYLNTGEFLSGFDAIHESNNT